MPPPDTTPVLLTDREGVEGVLGRCGVDAKLDVDRNGVVSATELEQLTFSINYASELTLAWCGKRYAIDKLAGSWLAYWWASTIAAYRLAIYRCGAVTASLQAEFEAVMELFRQVHVGQFQPASMLSSSGAGVAMDNLRLDPRYRTKQLRVEVSISDGHRDQKSPKRTDILGTWIDPLQRDS